MQLIFYMQISMKACYKLILWFFDGYGQAFPKFQKNQVCNVFTISLKKLEMKLTLLMQTKFPNSWFQHFVIKVFDNVLDMIIKTWRTWWWEWSSILKVLKVTSLQCLWNISRKKLWMEFSIFDLSYQFLMKVSRHVQSTKKRSLLILSNILRKSIATAFVFYCDAKHWDTLLCSSHVCCYLFLGGCGKKWAWSFRSWHSEISYISREWIDKMNWLFCMLIQI